MKCKPFLVPDLDIPTRWNRTYNMITKAHKIREMTDILVASNLRTLRIMYPTEDEWTELTVRF